MQWTIYRPQIDNFDHNSTNQKWVTECNTRTEEERCDTHLFEKEEVRINFLGNKVQNKRREKRKRVRFYYGGSVCDVCVFVCVCVGAHTGMAVSWSWCLWFYHLQWVWCCLHAAVTNGSIKCWESVMFLSVSDCSLESTWPPISPALINTQRLHENTSWSYTVQTETAKGVWLCVFTGAVTSYSLDLPNCWL